MMESCFHNKSDSVERDINTDDPRKDLFSEFHSQESCLEENEHLQVYLRIRPFTSTESENGESQVLGPETSQREMFDGTVRGLVKEVLEGGNSLVFTYGVTNAGKTFTFLGPEANAGILPRSLSVIFNNIEGRVYNQITIKPQRCREFIRLTKDQQSEEATSKRNLLKESDNQKSTTSQTTVEGSTLSDIEVTEDSFSLVVDEHTKFSVWVSFCEIYNENIHDLLEPIPFGALKRTTLRLSQDVKGNCFVKDLKWVQVNSAEEAYKVMKLGKKNQSFASTKLNFLSSRSHSIFSVRILRIEDARIPRVNSISELSLCDLAGSERCAKTLNEGQRLKEAGNINTSLMTLGKCINALRQSQQSKLPQHVPFRESKLTHYLQGFFCGRGKACMVVNINQCASMYDETLNVLKFSAVAQKVVVLTTKTAPHLATKRSARERSMINNNADRKNLLGQRRKSSLVGWETSLEDVQEDDDDTEEDSVMEDSVMEDSVMEDSVMEDSVMVDSVMEGAMQEVNNDKFLIDKDAYESQLLQLKELREQLQKERSENLALESRIRDEVTKEFSELFSEMQTDYKERLANEKEIVEERAERRLEILKNLVNKNTSQEELDRAELATEEDSSSLGEMFDSMCSDLAGIKKAAEAAKTCLVVTQPSSETVSNLEKRVADLSEQLSVKTNELEHYCRQALQSNKQLESLESQEMKFSHLLEICHEKDEKLQNTMHQQVHATIRDKTTFDGIKDEFLPLKSSCTCSRGGKPSSCTESRKRLVDLQLDLEEQPPSKKVFLEECSGEEETIASRELEEKSSEVMELVETLQLDLAAHGEGDWKVQEQLEELANNSSHMEAHKLKAELEVPTRASEEALSVVEVRRENARLLQEQEDLQREMSIIRGESQDLTRKLQAMEREVSLQTARADQAAENLEATHDHKVREKTALIDSLIQEVTRLGQEEVASQAASGVQRDSRLLRDKMAELKKECSKALEERLLLKEKLSQQQISEQELRELKEKLAQQQISEQELGELKEKLAQQQISEQELRELKEKLAQQQISEQELRELKEKLAQQQILEQELGELKEKLAQQQILEQELGELKEKLAQQQISEQELGELKEKLAQQQILEQELGELKEKLAQQQILEQELGELKEKLAQQQISEQELGELKEKLAQQQISEQELGELKEKLAQQQILEQELGELKEKLAQQQILEQELGELKEKLAQQQISEQELGELKEKLAQQQILEQELGELKEKLAQQQILEQELGELKEKLAQQQISEQELGELKEKLAQQQISEQELGELKEKLAQQQILEQELGELKEKLAQQQILEQELGELKEKLAQQQISEQELGELKEKLSQQELTLEQLRAEMEEAKANAHIDSENSVAERETAEGLRKLNSDLEAEVATLKGKMADLEEKEHTHQTVREEPVTVSQSHNDELMSQTERVAELEKTLLEKETQVLGLQRSLREAQERWEDEETAAVQEARRREVERRRELLAVAEEAIAQKDVELEKRAQDITRLKETAKLDSDKAKSLSLDLERKDDDNSDLKEKLADSKNQIQQVQKEIISMREEEKSLRLKVHDLERVKKQQQSDLANRDRTIHQLKMEQSTDKNIKLYQNACKDLQAKERMIEDMRLALTEQEDTQTQQEQVLEAKLDEIDALTEEVEKVKDLLRYQDNRKDTAALRDGQSDETKLAKQEAIQAQLTLKLCTEKHQADRRKWLEEKMVLIRQAKEAEDKRNQEMRKFADDRERHAKQQSQVKDLSAQLTAKEQDLLKWRKERDTLVAALEVQLTKLISSIANKDEQIASLRCNATSQPAESGQVEVEELHGLLSDRDSEILNLKEQLKASQSSSNVSAPPPTARRETANQIKADECPPKVSERTLHDNSQPVLGVKTEKRTSQGSGGYPSVLDSSEISTEEGRTRRFPKPELEISFSPLQPNRMALKREGEDVINVKITRSTRKRKSTEVEKPKQRATHKLPSQDEVNSENQRNTRTRLIPKLSVHQEEPSPAMSGKDPGSVRPQDSQSSLRNRKEGTMQKIGDFLQSSPTFFGSKAKKIMGLVSGKSPEREGGASMSFRPKKSKRKLYRPEISSPMDFPSHPIISGVPDEKESDHLIIKRKLRTRTAK